MSIFERIRNSEVAQTVAEFAVLSMMLGGAALVEARTGFAEKTVTWVDKSATGGKLGEAATWVNELAIGEKVNNGACAVGEFVLGRSTAVDAGICEMTAAEWTQRFPNGQVSDPGNKSEYQHLDPSKVGE